jgi:nitrite reductase/ring-hydroxylating ferredoxin subunit
VLVVREGDRLLALADRCTHRGGPLHEGKVVVGCIECPWHQSRFRLSDGEVEQGPATQAQPVFEARVVDGNLEVRRRR